MLALLQSAALQRFCSYTEYQILIPVTESLPWPVIHKLLTSTPHLFPSLGLTYSPGPLYFCVLVNASHLPSGYGSSLCGISHGSLCFCQPFWCLQTCGRCTSLLGVLHHLCLRSADEIGMPEGSTESAAGSQGIYWDVLVLQVAHMLYLRVKTCTVVCIWCQNRC